MRHWMTPSYLLSLKLDDYLHLTIMQTVQMQGLFFRLLKQVGITWMLAHRAIQVKGPTY